MKVVLNMQPISPRLQNGYLPLFYMRIELNIRPLILISRAEQVPKAIKQTAPRKMPNEILNMRAVFAYCCTQRRVTLSAK